MRTIADASTIDGPALTITLVVAGIFCAAWGLAWVLARPAATGDRVDPGCEAFCDGPPAGAAWFCLICVEPGCDERVWVDHRDDAGHVLARQAGVWRCPTCEPPATEVYDHVEVEALHADLAAFERGER